VNVILRVVLASAFVFIGLSGARRAATLSAEPLLQTVPEPFSEPIPERLPEPVGEPFAATREPLAATRESLPATRETLGESFREPLSVPMTAQAAEPITFSPVEEVKFLSDDSVFDILTRANESVIKNIDFADLALLLVFAALAVVSVFELDKIQLLATGFRFIADGALLASALLSIIGYAIGVRKTREAVNPGTFLIDFATNPEEATAVAKQGLVDAYFDNLRDRSTKRNLAFFAVVALFFGITITNIVLYLPELR
jgi:hypothetical protein